MNPDTNGHLTRELKPSSGKKTAFSANGAGTTGSYHVEECELIHSNLLVLRSNFYSQCKSLICHFLQCVFLIFHVLQCNKHIYHILKCALLIFHVFQSNLRIYHVLQFAFLIFHVFLCNSIIHHAIVCVSHLPCVSV
jgi:hypothetical protein